MKQAIVSAYNAGQWPRRVAYLEFKFIPWNGHWYLTLIQCYGTDYGSMGEWPRWAVTPDQQSQIDVAARVLPPMPHPDQNG